MPIVQRALPGPLLILGWLAAFAGGGGTAGGFAQDAAPSDGRTSPPTIAGPRDALRLHDIDESHFNNLTDGKPLGDGETEGETEILLKVMYWVRRFRMDQVEQWARDKLDLAKLAEDPESGRVEFFRLSGKVTQVDVLRPVSEVVDRLQMERYYRCGFLFADGQPAVIFTAEVPKKWQPGGEQEARASAFGLFLKLAGDDPDRPVPVFVAPRIAWHPPTLLGELGMDVGLLDCVVNRTELGRRRRIGAHDVDEAEVRRAARERKAFYAMLDAVGRAKPRQLLREAERLLRQAPKELKRPDAQQFSVVPLFNEPEKQHGRLVVLTGHTRRVVRVRVDDADVLARFGIDHYYNLYLFTEDSQGNPVEFCVRQLPEGMPVGDGPEYGERVRVAGFFLKTRAYHTQRSGEGSATQIPQQQLAPLLIGRQPVWYPRQESAVNPLVGIIGGGLFVLALVGVWIALWRYSRSDKRFHDQTLAKSYAMDSGISLNEIGLSADGTPDFSRLDEVERDSGR